MSRSQACGCVRERSYWRNDLCMSLAALGVLLAWERAALDLWVARAVGGYEHFPWRDTWVLSRLLHDGGRALSGLVLAILAWRALRSAADDLLGMRRRWSSFGLVLLNLIAVPALKRSSLTSCPWDLAPFGGHAQLLSHWAWAVPDGGPGHCFPSGHAVAAFAYVAMYFAWRGVRPECARAWFIGVAIAGAAFGAVQVIRGAHFVSHVAWSAWACWTLSALADSVIRRPRRPRPIPTAPADSPAAPPRA